MWEVALPRPVHLYLFVFSLGLAGAHTSACSGAAEQDVLATTTSQASSSSGGQSDAASSGSSGTSGGSSSGTSGGSGFVPTGPCKQEEEPNDGRQGANVIETAMCGTLSATDNRDFLQFRLKPTTKKLGIYFTGQVRLRIDVDDHVTTELVPGSNRSVPFVRDADYTIEVTALTDAKDAQHWRVDLVEQ